MTQDVIFAAVHFPPDLSEFAEFERQMRQRLADAMGLKPIHLGLKTCLSCGAIQKADGTIPCGH